ncbi:MAG: hypothetical protein OEV54_04520, partial [Dehalococcoidia bacterium]|nr:hypothetical protein [Dehalococcoidia bacterium]
GIKIESFPCAGDCFVTPVSRNDRKDVSLVKPVELPSLEVVWHVGHCLRKAAARGEDSSKRAILTITC